MRVSSTISLDLVPKCTGKAWEQKGNREHDLLYNTNVVKGKIDQNGAEQREHAQESFVTVREEKMVEWTGIL